MPTPEDLLNDSPGIDLTIIGGQALTYWTPVHRRWQEELLPDDIVTGTFNLDLIVRLFEDCERCQQHWDGRLSRPPPDLGTLEVAVLDSVHDGGGEFRVDFLQDPAAIDLASALRGRFPLGASQPSFETLFVISE